MTVPYTFGTATTSIPLSNLDSNFNTPITLGNTSIYLGNTTTTIGNLTLTNATISSGNVTISNVTVTTANVTNITVSGTTTLSGLTASTALALDASKNVVSVTNTGTGNNVLSASPTLTGTIAGASLSLSSLTSGRVTYATTSGLLTDSANLTFDGNNLTVVGQITSNNTIFSNGGFSGQGAYVQRNSTGGGTLGSLLSSGSVTFETNLTERMRIDSSGNVGIGTTAPQQRLGIKAASNVPQLYLIQDNVANDGYKLFADSSAGYLSFLRTSSGSDTERMRITSTGNVLINRTTVAGAGNVGLIISGDTDTTGTNYTFYTLYNNGAQVFGLKNDGYVRADGIYNKTSAGVANVNVDSGGLLTRGTSARKYKQDIRDLESIDINKFRPVRYKSKCENDDQTIDHFGIIADEVDEAGIKELVTYGSNGEVESFKYERLTVILLKEIQDLKQRIATLENK